MSTCNPCLLGQVFVDFLLDRKREPVMRLGGIVHAARALWCMGVPFGIGYVAPEYMKPDVEDFLSQYGASAIQHIGTISRCPNVVIVGEARETGAQRYEYLLRSQSNCDLHSSAVKQLIAGHDFSDFIVFPGGFPLLPVLRELSATEADVYADINFVKDRLPDLPTLGRRLASAILSTSSDLFLNAFAGDPAKTVSQLRDYADTVLLKENRGGSRLFYCDARNEPISVPCQIRAVVHSVGVGDFFDAVFIMQRRALGDRAALAYASFAAAEYACSFRDADMRESIRALLAIDPKTVANFAGVVLPWEARRNINIYLAAPDFDYVDTGPLDALADALAYHNFSGRRPVREHGQVNSATPLSERRRIAAADVELLVACDLLVAVLLYDDPGTLIEIGMAIDRQIPVIVYDPFGRASNLILTELPVLVSSDLDRVMAEVFVQAAKKKNG
jgi:sugar/nucleoside kinase (ribokinase family)